MLNNNICPRQFPIYIHLFCKVSIPIVYHSNQMATRSDTEKGLSR